jgi:hypothetical protein
MLKVEQRLADGTWHGVCSLGPEQLPHVNEQGDIGLNFWTHRIWVPLFEPGTDGSLFLPEVQRGDTLHLRVLFVGSFHPHEEIESPEIHLEVQLAEQALPQGRAAHTSGPRHWFYGDTHYHSAYTNDVKEFGGPVPETREAGHAIGLDWLVVTDHSCDLDDRDEGPDGPTRWERLKAELSSPALSDEQFRCILGEEITLRGGAGERYIHMLAFGAMEEMMEGGFLPDEEGGFMTKLFKEALDELLTMAIKEGGYAEDTADRLFGPVHTFAEVLDALPPATLTFAAHPYAIAQPPFVNCDWAAEDLQNPRLTGHEFWNGRSRRTALFTDDPFSRRGFADPERLRKADAGRIKKLQDHVEEDWDGILQRGIDEWGPAEDRPALRPVFIAGSDAHGSFNHSVGWGWDYQSQLMCNDNALGRVRTVVYLPEHGTHTVPETGDLLAALGKGACVVTDGPLLEVSLQQNGHTAHMGDLLTISGGGHVVLEIQAHTTAEFGAVGEVEVVTYFQDPGGQEDELLDRIGDLVDGWLGRRPRKTTLRAGESRIVKVTGSQGFCRVQARTVGQSGEQFCCFTNPIWVRIEDGRKARLRVRLAP